MFHRLTRSAILRQLLVALALAGAVFLLIAADDEMKRALGTTAAFWRVAAAAVALWLTLAWLRTHRKGRIPEAVGCVLVPALAGLMIALMLLFVFERWGASLSAVWMAEKWARALSRFAAGWLAAALILAALAALNSRAAQLKGLITLLSLLTGLALPASDSVRRLAAQTLRERQTRFVEAWTRSQKAAIEAAVATQAKTSWEMDTPEERQSVKLLAAQSRELGVARDRVLKSVTDWQTLEGDWTGPPARLRRDAALAASGISLTPGTLAEARAEDLAIAKEEARAREAEWRADQAWKAAGVVFGNDDAAQFLRSLARNWADKAFWAGVKPRLDKSKWTPALWAPGLYDPESGTSPLATQVRNEIRMEEGR